MENRKRSKDVIELSNFVSVSKEKYNPTSSIDFPCVELEHIEKEIGILNGQTRSLLQASIKNKFHAGDVLFGKLRPNLRKYAQPDFDGVCSTEIWVLNTDHKKCSKDFLFYLIQSERFIQAACKTTGSKMPRADWNFLSREPIYLPSLAEQKKIAIILCTWDDAVEKQRTCLKLVNQKKNALIQKIYSNFTSITESTTVSLGEIFFESKIRNRTLTKESVITVGKYAIKSQTEHFKRNVSSKDLTNYWVIEPGDFVYDPMSAYYGAIGRYSGKMPGIVSPAYRIIKLKHNISSGFIEHLLNTKYMKYQLQSRSSQGNKEGKRRSLQREAFDSIRFILPGKSVQAKIESLMQIIDLEITLHTKKLDKLVVQKRGLMQKLLTGEWSITGIDVVIEKGMLCLPKDSKTLYTILNSMLGKIFEDDRTNKQHIATSTEKFIKP